jgi:hypothetical protein
MKYDVFNVNRVNSMSSFLSHLQMLNSKALHFPSGYPMPRSPPLFICSSPGPDPYRSNDNVYEELEHRGERNHVNPVMRTNCDRQLHSDEEFAEDELSLPGDRSLNKSSSDNTTVATIYQERAGAGSTSNDNPAMYLERGRVERNSLLSSASDTSNAMRPNMRNSSSSNESSHQHLHHHHHHYNNTLNGRETSDHNGNNGGFFRFRTAKGGTGKGAKGQQHSTRGKTNNFSMNNLSSQACDEIPLSSYVGSSGNTGSSSSASHSDPISCSSNALINGNHIEGDTNNNNNNNCGRNNYYGNDSEVERRNRINAQLSAAAAANGGASSTQTPALSVATIFRDRNSMRNYHNHPAAAAAAAATASRANSNYYVPPQHIMMMAANRNDANNRLSRTNPRADRSSGRRHNNSTNNSNCSRENAVNNNNIHGVNGNEEYLYHEPVYHHHDNVIFDPDSSVRNQLYHQPYALPPQEFTTFRNFNNLNNPHQPLYNAAMNSDSGYSQNTQHSGRSLFSRRKRNGGSNNNNNNNNDDSISSIVRAEAAAAVEDAYLEGS